MTNDKMAEFQQLLSGVLSFYGAPPTTFARTVWWEACKPFELEAVRRAFTAHATDPERGQFTPKPADVVRQLAGTASDRANAAWRKVLNAAGQVGAYTDVVFDDPAIHATVADLGGWPKLCRTEQEQLGYVHHRFLEAYKTHATRGVADYPAKLLGDRGSDELYAKRGLPAPQPVLVGDSTKALEVLQSGGSDRHAIAPMAVMRHLPTAKRLGVAA